MSNCNPRLSNSRLSQSMKLFIKNLVTIFQIRIPHLQNPNPLPQLLYSKKKKCFLKGSNGALIKAIKTKVAAVPFRRCVLAVYNLTMA